MTTIRRLLALGRIRLLPVVASVILGTLAAAFGIALMATAGYLISRAAEHPPILELGVAIVAVRFFGIARPVARYFDRLVSHDLALGALGRIRSSFYGAIEPLAPVQLEGFRRGDLLTRMVGDVDGLQGLYLRGLKPAMVALVAGCVTVLVAAAFLPAAGVILAAGLLVAGVLVPTLTATLARSSGRRQAHVRAELTAHLVEVFQGASELIVYGREASATAEVGRLDGELSRLARRDAFVAGLGEAATSLATGLTVAGVLAVSVSAHAAGNLDRTLIAMLALFALSSFIVVTPLAESARDLANTLAGGRRVLELMDRTPAVRDPSRPAEPKPTDATALEDISLEGATARYTFGDPPVLHDFDLRLEPGSKTALVGPSGAGKTTVTNLLLRFLDPESGRVTIGGRDVRDLRQEDVRKHFALAGQEAHVFDSTIRANLALAKPDATDSELHAALRLARLDEWVNQLPGGLDTLVGEDGSRLSGGERQRLTIARALLSDAPVLLLDEPTAHLDPATAEALIGEVLDAATATQRTVLLVTHRSEGIERMDRVVRMG
jgi:thiol reductant ABC exporter CydC subunit